MTTDRDPDVLLAALAPAHRAVVLEWSRLLGLGDDGWVCAPGFRHVVELVAIVTTMDRLQAEDPTLADRVAFFQAAELARRGAGHGARPGARRQGTARGGAALSVLATRLEPRGPQ